MSAAKGREEQRVAFGNAWGRRN